MSTIASIGLSAMRAAEMRMQAASSNIANAQTTGRVPGATPQPGDVYTPVDVVQTSTDMGVSATYSPRTAGFSLVSDPQSPFATADGMVAAPNVDLATELSNVMLARIAYRAALGIVKASDDMTREAIDKLG